MIKKEDYSYISEDNKMLINFGFAKIGIHSINFDRHFISKEREENKKQSEILSKEDWGKRCDDFSKVLGNQIMGIMNVLNDNYDIHQINEGKSSMKHYNSDWDIFFYSNKGWNGKDYYDYVSLSFKDKRKTEDNLKLKDEILDLIMSIDNTHNVSVRVQYQAVKDEEKINTVIAEKCEKLLGKMITHRGKQGKIKVVYEDDITKEYGFFSKGAKSKYMLINNVELLCDGI